MIERIKKGEYVRSRYGYIAKCIDFVDKHNQHSYYIFDKQIDNHGHEEAYIGDESYYFVKHSANIFDLLEIGDIVNDIKIYKIEKDIETNRKYLYINDYCVLATNRVNSIMTKEFYENFRYDL